MKLKILILAAGMAMLSACGPSSRTADSVSVVVPDGTQTAFTTQYPGATNIVWSNYDAQFVAPIDWELSGWPVLDPKDYLVRFDMNNENYYAWYDSDGNWVGTAYVVRDFKTLPEAVNTSLNTQFPGYSITQINREFQKDRMAYEIEMKKDDSKVKLLVDGNGNVIKQKTRVQ